MSLEDININYESDINESNNDTSEDNISEDDQYENTINNTVINENNGLPDEDLDNIDFENIGMVPCEICETMINFNDYNSHVSQCVRNYNLRRERFNTLNGVINLLNTSYDMNRGNNINTMRTPLDEENINDNDVNVEYNEENDNNDENMGNVNTAEVNNTDVNSEDVDVVNADNAVNENNDELVEPYEQFMNSLSPLPNTRRLPEIFGRIPPSRNESDMYWINNMGRSLIRNLEINIGNLHNLTNENNNTEYDFNLLIQQLMGGDVKIGVKDFNKIIEPLKEDEINDDDECSICFDNLKDIINNINNQSNQINQSNIRTKLNIPVKTTCGHKYCRDCLYKWLSKNKNCPVCNNRFEEDDKPMDGMSDDISNDDEIPPLVSGSESDTIDDFIPSNSSSSNNINYNVRIN